MILSSTHSNAETFVKTAKSVYLAQQYVTLHMAQHGTKKCSIALVLAVVIKNNNNNNPGHHRKPFENPLENLFYFLCKALASEALMMITGHDGDSWFCFQRVYLSLCVSTN